MLNKIPCALIKKLKKYDIMKKYKKAEKTSLKH